MIVKSVYIPFLKMKRYEAIKQMDEGEVKEYLRLLKEAQEKYKEDIKKYKECIKETEQKLKNIDKVIFHAQGRLRALEDVKFYQSLLEKYGLKDNEKTRKAYSIAYEKDHSGGYSEIESEFDDLVPLLT